MVGGVMIAVVAAPVANRVLKVTRDDVKGFERKRQQAVSCLGLACAGRRRERPKGHGQQARGKSVCLYARHRTANLNYKRKEGPAISSHQGSVTGGTAQPTPPWPGQRASAHWKGQSALKPQMVAGTAGCLVHKAWDAPLHRDIQK